MSANEVEMSAGGDIVLWMPFAAPWRPHADPADLCCDAMRAALDFTVESDETPFDSNEAFLVYNAVYDEIGIVARDDVAQYLLISHCPWCGKAQPASRRDDWFDALEVKGFDDPNHQDIPAEFLSSDWRS